LDHVNSYNNSRWGRGLEPRWLGIGQVVVFVGRHIISNEHFNKTSLVTYLAYSHTAS